MKRISLSRYNINLEDTKTLWKIQNGECYYCGSKLGPFDERNSYQIDHVKPLSLGGHHSPGNLAVACVDCNLKKCKKTEEDFLKELSRTRGKTWLNQRKEVIARIKKEIRFVFLLGSGVRPGYVVEIQR